MAEDKPTRRKRRGSDAERRRLPAAQLAQQARRELAEITGLEAESVTALVRNEDGTWTITVELLELSRIPETDDLLGSYEVELDERGELLGYRRVRRYSRSQAVLEEQPIGG